MMQSGPESGAREEGQISLSGRTIKQREKVGYFSESLTL